MQQRASTDSPWGAERALTDASAGARAGPVAADADPVLCVDLDGTLIRGDVLWESALLLIRQRSVLVLWLLPWLCRGRAYLKRRLAELVMPDPETLPYRTEVIGYVQSEKAKGRRVVLATATHQLAAARIASHLGLFDDVVTTSSDRNLSGARKLAALQERYRAGFDYIGNSRIDLPVFQSARRSMLVDPPPKCTVPRRRVRKFRESFLRKTRGPPRRVNCDAAASVGQRSAARNGPGGGPSNQRANQLWAPLLAFVSFSLAASAIYVINDLLDIPSNRKHRTKRQRPVASGQLAIPSAVVLAIACLTISAALSVLTLPLAFSFWLAVYLLVTILYTLDLKRRLLVDVISLAGLYTIRILAGGAAASISISRWLLAFSMFIFMSLAFAKRYIEAAATPTSNDKLEGRGYWSSDADLIHIVGPALGLMSVLVMALYINSPDVRLLYKRPDVLWLLCPLLIYWITRVWFLAHRALIDDDPVLFAIRDWRSYAVVAAAGMVMLAASI